MSYCWFEGDFGFGRSVLVLLLVSLTGDYLGGFHFDDLCRDDLQALAQESFDAKEPLSGVYAPYPRSFWQRKSLPAYYLGSSTDID
jgi:hypothetical protein